MHGYQFCHIENWAKTKTKGSAHHRAGKRRDGTEAWTAEEILAEAVRLDGHARHVDQDGPPPTIIPGAAATFEEMRALYETASTVKRSVPYTNPKTKKRTTRKRRIQSNERTLHTAVFSLPVTVEEAHGDEALKQRCRSVLRAAVEHETYRIERLGGTFAMAVEHWDETHVHVHLFAVDLERGRVNHLHPGQVAKRRFQEAPENRELDPKAMNRGADNAYRTAMRAWQDELHDGVFREAGLLRLGPGRERLSRRDYKDAQRAAAERLDDFARQQEIRKDRAQLCRAGTALTEYSKAVEAEIEIKRKEVAAEKARAETATAEARAARDGVEDAYERTRTYLERKRPPITPRAAA